MSFTHSQNWRLVISSIAVIAFGGLLELSVRGQQSGSPWRSCSICGCYGCLCVAAHSATLLHHNLVRSRLPEHKHSLTLPGNLPNVPCAASRNVSSLVFPLPRDFCDWNILEFALSCQSQHVLHSLLLLLWVPITPLAHPKTLEANLFEDQKGCRKSKRLFCSLHRTSRVAHQAKVTSQLASAFLFPQRSSYQV